MPYKRNYLMIVGLFLLLASTTAMAQPKGGPLMSKDVFTPIAMGYKFIQEGKYAAAKHEFAIAVKRDPHNPFALNNLAVLAERAGRLDDALAKLKEAATHANDYLDKVTQTCFAGSGPLAVRPLRMKGETSTIAPIIQKNISKLETMIKFKHLIRDSYQQHRPQPPPNTHR